MLKPLLIILILLASCKTNDPDLVVYCTGALESGVCFITSQELNSYRRSICGEWREGTKRCYENFYRINTRRVQL